MRRWHILLQENSNFPETAWMRRYEQFQFSLNFSAGRAGFTTSNLLSLAYIDLVQSKYSAALEYLERARHLAPKSAAVAQLSGWGYYGLNRIDEAIKEWETAQSIQPSQQLATMIERAERDKAAESESREANSGHFNLRVVIKVRLVRSWRRKFSALSKIFPKYPIRIAFHSGWSADRSRPLYAAGFPRHHTSANVGRGRE